MNLRWNVLNEKNELVKPLRFEGKNQMDVVKEIIEAFNSYDFVFFVSPTGSGKSIIALQVLYNAFPSGIIVVPTKHLQKQYYTDYNPATGRFRIPNLRIKFILGRSNFVCPLTGKRCDDPNLPCTRRLNENECRFDVAKECPMWIPRYPKRLANKVRYVIEKDYSSYETASGEWVIFHSEDEEADCPYLRQYYEAYLNSEVVVMNDKLWLIETLAKRKPIWFRAIEVLDEVDSLLDSLVRGFSIKYQNIEKYLNEATKSKWDYIIRKKYVEREDVFDVIFEILKCLENNKANAESVYYKVNRIVDDFDKLTYKRDAENNKIYFFYKSPSNFVKEIFRNSNQKILGMSATLHDESVLQEYFGFEPDSYCIIRGKTRFPGTVYILKNRRWWVSHRNWYEIKSDFMNEVKRIVNDAVKKNYRVLIQAHAFKYVNDLGIPIDDAKHDMFELWKQGKIRALVSTRLKRGVDIGKKYAPKLLVIPKFPLPDKESMQIKCLFETLPEDVAGRVYRDIAKRDLIQQVGRVLRSDDDWAVVAVMDNLALNILKESNCWELREVDNLEAGKTIQLRREG